MTWVYRTCMVIFCALTFYNLQGLTRGGCDIECEACMERICLRCYSYNFFNDTQCQRCWLPYCQTCSKSRYCDICSRYYRSYECNRSCDYICRDYRIGIEICRFSNDTCYMCKDGYYRNQTTCLPCPYPRCQTCSDATHCDTCKTGYWGEQCNLTCSSGCLNNTCNMTDGSCVCKEGYFAKQCQHECAYSCAFSDVKTNQTQCNPITGECTHCQTGYFGRFCDSSCNVNCSARECEQMTGKCLACPLNQTYGGACENQCRNSCDQNKCYAENGNCSLGCILNHYGPQCEFTCSTNCKGTKNWVVCDANGACLGGCVDGYSGDKCLTEDSGTPGMVVVVAVVATIALIAITVLIVVIVILQAMLPERLSFSQLIRKGLVLCPLKTRRTTQTEPYQDLSTNEMDNTYQNSANNQGNYENTEADASAPGVSVISDQVYYNADM